MREVQESISRLLEGFNAIVTGGGQGLGFGSALWLARAGARVVIADKDGQLAEQAAALLPGKGHMGRRCDVTRQEDRIDLLGYLRQTIQQVHVLVNNAGITYIAPAEEMDEAEWRAVFEVNVHGLMFMACEAAKLMLSQGAGSIINIGSINSVLAMPKRSAYVATKTSVLGITRTLAVEWASRGVRVNAVCPGYHRTPLLERYLDTGLVEEAGIRRSIPMGRIGSIDDVGKAVLFFASSLSEYITGQFLMIDGGYTVFGAPGDASL